MDIGDAGKFGTWVMRVDLAVPAEKNKPFESIRAGVFRSEFLRPFLLKGEILI